MSTKEDNFKRLFISLMLFLAGILIGVCVTNSAWRKLCIDAGLGEYNRTNAQFQFVQPK